MKRFLLLAGAALACASLSACATTSTGVSAVVSPATQVDAKAIKAEKAVAALAVAVDVFADDPALNIDRVKLRANVLAARALLDQGRQAYDLRTGSPAALAGQALALISSALPADVPTTARAALAAARAAVAVYTIGLSEPGLPVAPSAALVDARKSADGLVDALVDSLPPPGG